MGRFKFCLHLSLRRAVRMLGWHHQPIRRGVCQMNRMLATVALLLCSTTGTTQNLLVGPNNHKISRQAGEAQSTVIPPGKKGAPKGRFLVSIDGLRPPVTLKDPKVGMVIGRNLNDLDG